MQNAEKSCRTQKQGEEEGIEKEAGTIHNDSILAHQEFKGNKKVNRLALRLFSQDKKMVKYQLQCFSCTGNELVFCGL